MPEAAAQQDQAAWTAAGLPAEVHIAIPTRDGCACVQSLIEIQGLEQLLGCPVGVYWTEASNIPKARNALLQGIERRLRRKRAWVLWLDSDVMTGGAEPIAAAIRWSWGTGRAWIAACPMADGRPNLFTARAAVGDDHYTWEQLAELPPWSEIAMGGPALMYEPADLTYQFHADVLGEDLHYFLDRPDLRVHYAKEVRLTHRKAIWLPAPEMPAPVSAELGAGGARQ